MFLGCVIECRGNSRADGRIEDSKMTYVSKSFIVAAALATAGLVATSASAATIMSANGTPLTYMIKNAAAQPDGNLLVLNTQPGDYAVDYSSSSIIHYNGSSGGFAEVTGPGAGGGTGFADLTIDPQSPISGMSAIKFNVDVPAAQGGPVIPNGYQTSYTFETIAYFVGGGSQTFTGLSAGSGENRFIVTAGAGESIDAIKILDLVGVSTKHGQPDLTNNFNFDAMRQVSFDGMAVPEPATWAIMLMGFGGMGAAIRSKRRRQAAIA
jgi:hypothetical protein